MEVPREQAVNHPCTGWVFLVIGGSWLVVFAPKVRDSAVATCAALFPRERMGLTEGVGLGGPSAAGGGCEGWVELSVTEQARGVIGGEPGCEVPSTAVGGRGADGSGSSVFMSERGVVWREPGGVAATSAVSGMAGGRMACSNVCRAAWVGRCSKVSMLRGMSGKKIFAVLKRFCRVWLEWGMSASRSERRRAAWLVHVVPKLMVPFAVLISSPCASAADRASW